jgi:hypothetical protein
MDLTIRGLSDEGRPFSPVSFALDNIFATSPRLVGPAKGGLLAVDRGPTPREPVIAP